MGVGMLSTQIQMFFVIQQQLVLMIQSTRVIHILMLRREEEKKRNDDLSDDNDDDDDKDVAMPGSAGGVQPDSRLWFFHVIMAAGSLYMAMLLTDWGTGSVTNVFPNSTSTTTPSGSGTANYVSNSTGATQMWVKIASQWFAIGLYTWTLVAKRCLPDRDFD